tara:strand:+ start:416 stop:724 length:309 start_codon:yes stop_codon:yes gene_type:complete
MHRIFLFIILFTFLFGCKSAKDVLTLKKKNNADEFLVEKKSPLVVPPDFDKLPTPINKDEDIISQKEQITGLAGNSDTNFSIKKKKTSKSDSIESTILEKIK